jgi:hypothetical protein
VRGCALLSVGGSIMKPSDIIDMVLLSCIAMPKSRAGSIHYMYIRESIVVKGDKLQGMYRSCARSGTRQRADCFA